MDRWLLTFFIGAILSLFLAEVPAVSQLFLLFFVAISTCFHKTLRYSSGLWFGALWMLGNGYAYQQQLPQPLAAAIEQRQAIAIEGSVLTLQSQANKTTDVVKPLKSNETTIQKINSHLPSSTTKLTEGKVKQGANYSTQRFTFTVVNVNGHRLDSPVKLRLTWQNSPLSLYQGQQLALNVKLKMVHGLSNLGGFNYVSWLKSKNIVATGYVKNDKKPAGQARKKLLSTALVNQTTHALTNRNLGGSASIRQYLFNEFHPLMPEHFLTPVIIALAFGERGLLTSEHWQVLQSTGTSHLIAISGLHIGLLAGGSFYVFMFLLRLLPLKQPSWQSINIRYTAILVSLLMASFYAYLAGFSLPTQRALLMLYLYWLARLLAIHLSFKRLLLITLFLLLLISPFSVMTASFWLSFYAVTVIFLTLWRFKAWLIKGASILTFVKGVVLIQIMLTVMLMPITALFFQEISLVSLVANTVAVPWMSFITIPTVLLSIVMTFLNDYIASMLMTMALYSMEGLWLYLMLLSDQAYASVKLSQQGQFLVLTIIVILFIRVYCLPLRSLVNTSVTASTNTRPLTLLAKRLTRSHWCKANLPCMNALSPKNSITVLLGIVAILLAVSSIFMTVYQQNWLTLTKQKFERVSEFLFAREETWQVTFFDVGQGLSVLIRKNNQAILYDTGASFPSGFSMSDAVVLPYLHYKGINSLDKLILSHSDNDHAGGLSTLLSKIKIDQVMSNDNQLSQLITHLQASTRQQDCHSEQHFKWQGLTFNVLWPLAQANEVNPENITQLTDNYTREHRHKPRNDDSCVMLITDKHSNSLLLSGDISAKVEKQLVLSYPNVRAAVLQVPHHGSKTSSSQRFLEHLSPQLAIVSAGYLNRWGMPVAEVRQRYKANNITLINNADVGQVNVTFTKKGYEQQSFTENLRPFWFNH